MIENLIKLSVVMPVYSESESIVELVNYLNENFKKYLYEIIIVYHPNSKKKCIEILNQLNYENPNLKIYPQDLKDQGGNGSAYRQGYSKAKGTHVLMIDSDGEMDVKTVNLMIPKIISENPDIIIGSRYVKGGGMVGYPFHLYILNTMFQYIFRILFMTKIKDLTCGYKILKKEIVEKFKWKSRFQDIGAETTLRPLFDNATIVEVPTIWTKKDGDKHPLSILGKFRYPLLALKILFRLI